MGAVDAAIAQLDRIRMERAAARLHQAIDRCKEAKTSGDPERVSLAEVAVDIEFEAFKRAVLNCR